MDKIHLRSLESTLRENSEKAQKKTKIFLFWVFILSSLIVLATLIYEQSNLLCGVAAIGLLALTIHYYTVLKSHWKTSERIKQKIRELKTKVLN